MEYTQWDVENVIPNDVYRLNPCCNGIYSMRESQNDINTNEES